MSGLRVFSSGFPFARLKQSTAAGNAAIARRAVLLLGTSLAVYTVAAPSAAMAQNECGAPPPGGGTVTCTPAGNPYPSGIDYDPPAGLVADLTVVLQPGVVVTNAGTPAHPNGVEIGSSTAGVDLSLQAGTQTQITTTAANHDAVDVVATDGTVAVAVDDVDTTQSGSRGIVASGRGRTVVTADTVATLGDNADGISAEEGNFVLPGSPPSADGTSVTVNSVSTLGDNSTGLIAFSENGDVIVDVGTVTTGGDFSTAILAISAVNDVRVTSDTVTTAGTNSVGIEAQIFPFPDETPVGRIVVNSGSVTTTGDGATGILATSPTTDVTVVSGAVSTSGDDAAGIRASVDGQFLGPGKYTFGEGDIVIQSGTVATTGDNSDGIVAVGAGDISVTSASVSTRGDESGGIYAEAYFDGAIVITSGTVTTLGDTLPVDYGESHGIWARTEDGSINITSTSVSTSGAGAIGILAETGVDTGPDTQLPPFPPPSDARPDFAEAAPVAVAPDISITSGAVATIGTRAPGISASTTVGDIHIESATASTRGNGSGGIIAETETGTITIDSGTVTTTGNTILGQPGVIAAGAHGIEATTVSGAIDIGSTSITTGGTNANGIKAVSESGAIVVDSGTIRVADGQGIEVRNGTGNVTVDSVSVTTLGGLFSDGIIVETDSGDIDITSGTASVVNGVGLFAITDSGDINITSTAVTVSGDITAGISASGDYYTGGDIDVTSGTVATTGRFADAITVSTPGIITIASTGITTAGEGARGIVADSGGGGVTIDSGTIATTGVSGRAIKVNVYYEAGVVIRSGTITTQADNGDGITVATLADNSTGDFDITSTSVSTRGHRANGIYAYHAGTGDIVVTSGSVTTLGNSEAVPYGGALGIDLQANSGSIRVTSTNVRTEGTNSIGIRSTTNAGSININSGTVTSLGSGAIGIFAQTGPGSTVPEVPPQDDDINAMAPPARPPAAAPVAVPPDIGITSATVTTSGANAHGIVAQTVAGDIYIESGTVTTAGSNADGIVATSQTGSITIDANAVNVAGTGADAIVTTSAAAGTFTIRGLVRSTLAFAVQADGGPATIGILAGGTVRGRVDLTEGVDRINNAGTFDAIGTSLFGGGADVFTNTGITRSVNGAAVLTSVDTFNSSGRIEMNDGAAGDRLTIGGTFNGLTGSRLAIDVDFAAGTADVLVTGLATGTTGIEATGIGQNQGGFTSGGILLVDAAAGTQASAFTLVGGTSTSNAYISSGLIFDAANFDFLLGNTPNQPVFETAVFAEMNSELWYRGADAVSAQLEAARDGSAGDQTGGMSQLMPGGRLGAWAQVVGASREREASQAFGTTIFDISYEQDFRGIQAGLDHQTEGLIFGLTFGLGRSDVEFETSPSTLELETLNAGAYAQIQAGTFFANALVKVDWIDAETVPGPGLETDFDATAIGARLTAGFRFDLGGLWAEPAASLSWVSTDISDYVSGGATLAFDDATSLRGSLGVRVGGDFAAGAGTLSPSLGIHAIEELNGSNRNDFTFGSVLALEQDAPGTFGRATAGLTYSSGSLEAFIRGEMDFGGETEGRGGRLGLRLRF
ncbi:MAG TPA: autotransporter domain-containing protein [Allosphingosinicella sp.]|nr:autotransporter domain-containing protein [Allosphingosinicella sp.]